MNAKDEGQEWEERGWDVLWEGDYILSNASPLAREWIVTLGNEKAALEERVRVLEEALREAVGWMPWRDADRLRALLSPAAATEGGEGA